MLNESLPCLFSLLIKTKLTDVERAKLYIKEYREGVAAC